MDQEARERLEAVEKYARNRVITSEYPLRDKDFFKRFVKVPQAPIIIATSEDIGTVRARGCHPDSSIDFFEEQEALKRAGIPIR